MSRSRRRTPIFAMTTATSEKMFKAFEHRRERRAVRVSIHGDQEPPAPKEFGNPWRGPKDGKRYWQRATAKDMRK